MRRFRPRKKHHLAIPRKYTSRTQVRKNSRRAQSCLNLYPFLYPASPETTDFQGDFTLERWWVGGRKQRTRKRGLDAVSECERERTKESAKSRDITPRTVGVSFVGLNREETSRKSRVSFQVSSMEGRKRNRRGAEAKRDVTERSFRIPIIQRKQKPMRKSERSPAVSGSERD